VERDPHVSLMAFTERYFHTQVAGQVEGTVNTKRRDLAYLLGFYTHLYRHDDRQE
jgi:hypothetical protein